MIWLHNFPEFHVSDTLVGEILVGLRGTEYILLSCDRKDDAVATEHVD
jgi:hypothetical protein